MTNLKRRRRAAAMLAAAGLAMAGFPAAGRALSGPPGNDGAASPTVISALPFTSTTDATLATRTPDEPTDCGNSDLDGTVWFAYTAPSDGAVAFDTVGTDTRSTAIGVYTGDPAGALTPVACQHTQSLPFQRLVLRVVAGTTYRIEVESGRTSRLVFNATQSGSVTGHLADTTGAPVSAACVDAVDSASRLAGGGRAAADGSYTIPGLPADTYTLHIFPCVWPAVVTDEWAPSPVVVQPGSASTVDVTVHLLPVLTGTVTDQDGQPVSNFCVTAEGQSNDAYASTDASGHYKMVLPAAGVDYTIGLNCTYDSHFDQSWEAGDVVGGLDSVTTHDITVQRHSAPANDAFANAVELTPDAVATLDTRLSTTEQGEPRCGVGSGGTAWYHVTSAPGAGDLELDALDAGTYRAALGVYTGNDLANLTQVGCLDPTQQSDTRYGLVVPAGSYYVQVASPYYYEPESFTLRVSQARGRVELNDNAPLPCALACPYWTFGQTSTANGWEAACQPNPTAPPLSWVDEPVDVPAAIDGHAPRALGWHIDPKVDYDGFLCRTTPDAHGRYFVATSSDNLAGSTSCPLVTTGCPETAVAPVEPGGHYVLRLYNWSDANPVTGSYEFVA
jgi:hypothetical protein